MKYLIISKTARRRPGFVHINPLCYQPTFMFSINLIVFNRETYVRLESTPLDIFLSDIRIDWLRTHKIRRNGNFNKELA